ncbi:hypothetical protein PVAP13_8NG138602 [Panicum virgatum]|uniref:Uncharacterized protein n=1 Tax=Panicum virgatum TaxID=38727 RepID=A0A8T0P8N7_PANVG|nr:hypothetical protein PVAP13_8NG138602 [Panicum virgatum]
MYQKIPRKKVLFDPSAHISIFTELFFSFYKCRSGVVLNSLTEFCFCLSCSDPVYDNWLETPHSMLPIYKELIGAGLKVWVFSGDTDTVVPLTSTRRSLASLGLPVKTSWYPWYIVPSEATNASLILLPSEKARSY